MFMIIMKKLLNFLNNNHIGYQVKEDNDKFHF